MWPWIHPGSFLNSISSALWAYHLPPAFTSSELTASISMPKIHLWFKRLAQLSRGVIHHTLWGGWMLLHLFLPVIYRLELRQETCLPPSVSQAQGYYQIYSRVGHDWTTRATRLQTNWTIFRDISVVILGVTTPYMGMTKATISPATFALGSLCILYSLVGCLIAHVYIANGENLHKPVVIDYWLKASDGPGLWMWTIISLPAVWLIPSVFSFFAFIVSAAWEVPQPMFNHPSTYKALLLSEIAWAMIHGVMVFVTWLKIKDRSSLA